MAGTQETGGLSLRGESMVSDQRLKLVCGECGKRGTYGVGRIFIDPERLQKTTGAAPPMEPAVTFTGLFRCKQCGGSGPWEFPPRTAMWLAAMVFGMVLRLKRADISIGLLQLFDGTRVQCGAAAEDYLKQKIAESPDDAFLWNRLGNLYDNAGHKKLARPAYERALQLDPGEIESNHTLGCYHMNDGDRQAAAECFQRIARHARTAPRRDPEFLEEIVRDTLSKLFDLHCETDGEIPFPPDFDVPPPQGRMRADEPAAVYLTELDLGTDEAWDTLTTLCLTGKMPQHEMERVRKAGEAAMGNPRRLPAGPSQREKAATASHDRRVGRNAPCPCGSGRKYKRCCGKR